MDKRAGDNRFSTVTPRHLLKVWADYRMYALASAWVLLWGGVGAGGAGAILAGVQTSFLVLALAVIWAFSPVRLLRVWLMFLGLTAGMLVLAFVLKHWGG